MSKDLSPLLSLPFAKLLWDAINGLLNYRVVELNARTST